MTPLSAICLLNAGRKVSAMLRCTSSVSTVLQVLGRWVLALTMIFSAGAISAVSSTKIWHTPIPPVITGIVDCSRHSLCRPAPPRGISISMYLSIFSISPTSARSGLSIACTAAAGRPHSCSACWITFTVAALVRQVSFPPRRIAALPVFRHREATSTVTLGRAS